MSQCATAKPDGLKRAFIIGGNISNTANIATTYNGLIRALREKVGKLHSHKGYIIVVFNTMKLQYMLMQQYFKLRCNFIGQNLLLVSCFYYAGSV